MYAKPIVNAVFCLFLSSFVFCCLDLHCILFSCVVLIGLLRLLCLLCLIMSYLFSLSYLVFSSPIFSSLLIDLFALYEPLLIITSCWECPSTNNQPPYLSQYSAHCSSSLLTTQTPVHFPDIAPSCLPACIPACGCLIILTLTFAVGTSGIILQAPTLYDTRPAIDEDISQIITPWQMNEKRRELEYE